MALVRYVVPALVGGLLWADPLRAQDTTGTITGQVIDVGTQQGLAGVIIRIEATPLGTQTRVDGGFTLTDVPPGIHKLRLTRIGYAPLEQDVTVTSGAVTPVNFALHPQAAILEPLVVTDIPLRTMRLVKLSFGGRRIGWLMKTRVSMMLPESAPAPLLNPSTAIW